jgi:hypothetical protein
VIIVVSLFLSHELLVTLADDVISAVVDEHIPRKQRLTVVGNYAGFKTVIGGFDVAIACVYSDDFCPFEIFHVVFLLDNDFVFQKSGGSYQNFSCATPLTAGHLCALCLAMKKWEQLSK